VASLQQTNSNSHNLLKLSTIATKVHTVSNAKEAMHASIFFAQMKLITDPLESFDLHIEQKIQLHSRKGANMI